MSSLFSKKRKPVGPGTDTDTHHMMSSNGSFTNSSLPKEENGGPPSINGNGSGPTPSTRNHRAPLPPIPSTNNGYPQQPPQPPSRQPPRPPTNHPHHQPQQQQQPAPVQQPKLVFHCQQAHGKYYLPVILF